MVSNGKAGPDTGHLEGEVWVGRCEIKEPINVFVDGYTRHVFDVFPFGWKGIGVTGESFTDAQ